MLRIQCLFLAALVAACSFSPSPADDQVDAGQPMLSDEEHEAAGPCRDEHLDEVVRIETAADLIALDARRVTSIDTLIVAEWSWSTLDVRLPCLREADTIVLANAGVLRSGNFFTELADVHDLETWSLPALRDWDSLFPALVSASDLRIGGTGATEVRRDPALILRSILVDGNPNLRRVEGLRLAPVSGALSVADNPALTSWKGQAGHPIEVTQAVRVAGSPVLDEMDVLGELVSVPAIAVQGVGLPELRIVAPPGAPRHHVVEVTECARMIALEIDAPGRVVVAENTDLRELLFSMPSAASIDVVDNGRLTSVRAPSLYATRDGLTIVDNERLDQCEAAAIGRRVTGPVEIGGNGPCE